MKYIQEDKYGQVIALYFKKVNDYMKMFQLLYDDCSILRAIDVAQKCGKVDFYVSHKIQEEKLVLDFFYLPTYALECEDGVITQQKKEVLNALIVQK